MSEDGKEAFLERWSRMKREQPAKEADHSALADAKPEKPAAPLPPVEQLKPESDFAPFMAPKVDPVLRRAALKKLFGDAHFNVPDAFEPYSADFTQGEAIPARMLEAINRARDLAVKGPETVAEEKRLAEASENAKPSEASEKPAQEHVDVPGRQDA